MLTSHCSTFVTTRKLTGTLLLTEHHTLFRFHWFPPRPFSVRGTHLGHHIAVKCHVVFVSSSLWQLLRLSLCLIVLRNMVLWNIRCLVECPLVCVLSDVFLLVKSGAMGFGRKTTEGDVSFSPHVRGMY